MEFSYKIYDVCKIVAFSYKVGDMSHLSSNPHLYVNLPHTSFFLCVSLKIVLPFLPLKNFMLQVPALCTRLAFNPHTFWFTEYSFYLAKFMLACIL